MKEPLISERTSRLAKAKGILIRPEGKWVSLYNRKGLLTFCSKDSPLGVAVFSNKESRISGAYSLWALQQVLREQYNIHPYVVPYGEMPSTGVETWKISNIRFLHRSTEENMLMFSAFRNEYKDKKFESFEAATDEALFNCLNFI